MKSRKASADLLLEIILSSVIFFIIVAFLFTYQADKVQLKAKATVISADAAIGCEQSLVNLLRAPTSAGISYSEWLMNSYLANNISSWNASVTELLDRTFADSWKLDVSLPGNVNILSTGHDLTGSSSPFAFSCTVLVPYPAGYADVHCWNPHIEPISWKELTQEDLVDFETLDGNVSCKIEFKGGKFGFASSSKDCNLDLNKGDRSIFEESFEPTKTNTESLDKLTLPILVGENAAQYEITIEEIIDKQKVSVYLKKRALLEDCSFNLTMQTTNISLVA